MRRWREWIGVVALLGGLTNTGWVLAQEPEGPALAAAAPAAAELAAEEAEFRLFSFMNDPQYNQIERISLWVVLAIAIAGLLYAGLLVGQVSKADKGTPKMQAIALAIRQGANAYLTRQFKAIVGLVFLIDGDSVLHGGVDRSREDWPRSGLLHGCDLLLAGRLRRHEPGRSRQPEGGRRRSSQLRRSASARLPHGHHHRHADRRPGSAGRHDHLHGLRRTRV